MITNDILIINNVSTEEKIKVPTYGSVSSIKDESESYTDTESSAFTISHKYQVYKK